VEELRARRADLAIEPARVVGELAVEALRDPSRAAAVADAHELDLAQALERCAELGRVAGLAPARQQRRRGVERDAQVET
jgi:hypothetical protein